MAKKQTKKEPPIQATVPRPGSRHKPRNMVALSPSLYERLKKIAERNQRPTSWEIRLALEEHARREEAKGN